MKSQENSIMGFFAHFKANKIFLENPLVFFSVSKFLSLSIIFEKTKKIPIKTGYKCTDGQRGGHP